MEGKTIEGKQGVILTLSLPSSSKSLLEKSVTLLDRNHGCEDLTFRVEEGEEARPGAGTLLGLLT